MALDPVKLIETLDQKATEYMGASYTSNNSEIKEKLFKVIAEAVIEHFQQYAEVKVLIVGSDVGAAIADYEDRFQERGDTPIPDTELGATILASATSGVIATSLVLSNSGFID